MKKAYTKPQIAVESFQLDAAIAGSCSTQQGFIPINTTENSCGFDKGDSHKFAFFNFYNCDIDLVFGEVTGGGDGNDAVCYHGPILGMNFVTS